MIFKSQLEAVMLGLFFSDAISDEELASLLSDFYKKNSKQVDRRLEAIINSASFPKEEIKKKFFNEPELKRVP